MLFSDGDCTHSLYLRSRCAAVSMKSLPQLFLLSLLAVTNAYRLGAPIESCALLYPIGHNYVVRNSSATASLDLNISAFTNGSYIPGNVYTRKRLIILRRVCMHAGTGQQYTLAPLAFSLYSTQFFFQHIIIMLFSFLSACMQHFLSSKTACLSVILESTVIYRGFLVQGRLKADEKTPVGKFSIANGVRLMDCHALPNVSKFEASGINIFN